LQEHDQGASWPVPRKASQRRAFRTGRPTRAYIGAERPSA